MKSGEILRFEEESAEAWPCFQSELLGGWLMRAAGGFTGRANTVYPLSDPGMGVESAVQFVRSWYDRVGVRAGFKLTGAAVPTGLDAFLESNGFGLGHGAAVMTRRLAIYEETGEAHLSSELTDDWLEVYLAGNRTDSAQAPLIRALLQTINAPHAYGGCVADGRIVSCALGVVVNHKMWLFDIATLPDHRRKGLARNTLRSMFRWGAGLGATMANLQVVPTNAPAIMLYKSLGFTERYRYWYRFAGLQD